MTIAVVRRTVDSIAGGEFGSSRDLLLGRNAIINSNFDFWQRGITFTTPASATYTSDRWLVGYDGTIGTFSISQQTFSLGQTSVPNEPTYFLRWNQTVAGSGSTARNIVHKVESVRTFAGKSATISFWAKADTTRTVGVSVDQYFGTGGSSPIAGTIFNASLTTTWQMFTFTWSFASISGKTLGTNNDHLELTFRLPLNTTMTIDFAQVMFSEGTSTAPYVMTGVHIGHELQLCQRYYEAGIDTAAHVRRAMNYIPTQGFSWCSEQFMVQKRANPVMTFINDTGGSNSVTVWTTGGSVQQAPVGVNSTLMGYSFQGNAFQQLIGCDYYYKADAEL